MKRLECKNLTIGYDSKIVLKNINFNVNKGDFLVIVGENGTGKTTLMKTIAKLQKKISGTIDYAGHTCTIGYLPQQNQHQKNFPASVEEIVLSGCQASKKFKLFYNKNDKSKVVENLKKLGIENLKKKCYNELSGGQQQRVLLARALCAVNDLLLLDEPTASLDPKASDKLYKVVKRLNEESKTILMISHDIDESLKYATHILHLGENLFFGTKEEYLKSSKYKAYKLNKESD